MPKEVKDILKKIIKNFMWNLKSKFTIDLNILKQIYGEEDYKVLHVQIKNEAIKIMKIQKYLRHNNKRHRWIHVTNKIIEIKLSKKFKMNTDIIRNIFLQDVVVDTRIREDCLPVSTRNMIKIAKKYKIRFLLLSLSIHLKEKLLVELWVWWGYKKNKSGRRNKLQDCPQNLLTELQIDTLNLLNKMPKSKMKTKMTPVLIVAPLSLLTRMKSSDISERNLTKKVYSSSSKKKLARQHGDPWCT